MQRIEKHPSLLKRFEQLLSIVENSTGDIQKPIKAEMRVIKELREMGNEALTACGELQTSSISQTTMIHARSHYENEELTILLSKNHGDKTMPIRLPPKAKFPIEMDETFVGGATQIDFFCQVRIIL